MIDALNLIVEELVKEDLTAKELRSLEAEISKNSCLVESLRNAPKIGLAFIGMESVQSQPLSNL